MGGLRDFDGANHKGSQGERSTEDGEHRDGHRTSRAARTVRQDPPRARGGEAQACLLPAGLTAAASDSMQAVILEASKVMLAKEKTSDRNKELEQELEATKAELEKTKHQLETIGKLFKKPEGSD